MVVTIPTQLAVLESGRLMASLRSEGVRVSAILCNQIVSAGADSSYVNSRVQAQQSSIAALTSTVAEINDKAGGGSGQALPLAASTDAAAINRAVKSSRRIEITEVPYLDKEVRGVFGLRYFYSVAHKAQPRSATNPLDSKKLTVFGGKGGVGEYYMP